jgi:carbon monoxide dehydrogenase subunit G
MPASPEVTWALLQDIEAVASCMPGAAITERIDAQHYKGTMALKVGPASLKFKGEIEVKELDAATRTLRLIAKGTDTSGSSAASMDLTARVEAADGGLSKLVGHSDASVSGKVAAFASRMMDAVADQMLKQFAANFAARVVAQQPASAQATASEAAPGPVPPAASAPPLAPQQELNGLALLWAVVKDWLRGLFSKKTA